MDARIILAGQQPDMVNVLRGANIAAQERIGFDRQNAMNAMFRQQGPGIVAGDPAALNALAQFDPQAALQVQGQRQSMSHADEAMGWKRQEVQRAAATWAQQQDAATVAAEAEKTNRLLRGAATFHAQGDREGYQAFLQREGIDPAQYPFEQFPAIAAMAGDVLGVWKDFLPKQVDPTNGAPSGYMWNAPGDPAAGVTPLPGYQKTPGVVVNTGDMGTPRPEIGTVPQGFAAIPDPNVPAGYRMVRIPGGPEDMSAKDDARNASTVRATDVVLNNIGQLRNLVEGSSVINPATGFGAGLAARIGGTNASDAAALIDTISANIGFDRLGQMRAESPTGGALGAITERELALLSAVLGSLSQTQSDTQFLQKLQEIEVIYQSIAEKAAAYPNAARFGFGAATGAGAGSGSQPLAAPVAPPGPVVIDGFTVEPLE